MKYCIDDKVALKYNMSIAELLLLMILKQTTKPQIILQRLLDKDMIVKDIFDNYIITDHWNDEMQKVLLESDKEVPKEKNLTELVENLRELFPKGIKTGSAAWRGNKREITLRLQKFFKIYGNTYSNDDILKATKQYVDSFNGNYTYMRILKYFILKDERKINDAGEAYVEQVSELANFLENEMTEDSSGILELR